MLTQGFNTSRSTPSQVYLVVDLHFKLWDEYKPIIISDTAGLSRAAGLN